MRVSENTAFSKAIDYVQKSKMNLEKAQEKVGSLKRINKPSDDPIGMVRLLKLRAEKAKISDMNSNIDSARAFLNVSDGSLDQATEVLMRAKELALRQAGDVGGNEVTRRTTAEEVHQLANQMLKISNSKLGGRYIFSGFRTNTPAFTEKGTYKGDGGEIKIEVSDKTFVPINLPGNMVFKGQNRRDGEAGIDILGTIESLETGLVTNNKLLIQDCIEKFDDCLNQVLFSRSIIGARLNSLDNLRNMHAEKELGIDELVSEVEDADVYKAFSDLKKNENVLKTTLASSSKLIQPSLLDFLR